MPTSEQLRHFNTTMSAVIARAQAVGLEAQMWSAETATCQVLELRFGDFNAGYVEVRQAPEANPDLPVLKAYLIAPGDGRPYLRKSYMLDEKAVVTGEMDAAAPESIEAGLAVLDAGLAAVGRELGVTPPEYESIIIERDTVNALSWMIVNALDQARENIAGYASEDAIREHADLQRVVAFLEDTNLLDADRRMQLTTALGEVHSEIRPSATPRP